MRKRGRRDGEKWGIGGRESRRGVDGEERERESGWDVKYDTALFSCRGSRAGRGGYISEYNEETRNGRRKLAMFV